MPRPKPINVVCTALFAGIILTCTFFFGITSFNGKPPAASDTAYTDDMVFADFSGAFYYNSELLDIADNIDNLLFGSMGSSDIILGSDSFLFDAGTEANGYSYLRDYIGDAAYHDSELEALANILRLRQLAYKNQGVEYLLVVIPNSQTVYSDRMPSYMGRISDKTRLAQLTQYIEQRGYSFYLDTSDVMNRAKTYGKLLYNNTENSLNSLGEWYLYDAVCNKLEELYGIRGSKVGISTLDLFVRSTDGKTLARRAGLSSVILNKTISLSNSTDIRYSTESYYGSMVKTVIPDEYYAEGAPRPVVLLEFTDEWDRIQLMPYFSDTYTEVTYKTNHQFSRLVVDDLKPTAVVQFIHEYEIYDMLDSNTLLTYNAGLKLSIDEHVTSSPLLVSQCSIDSHTVCIAGETEYNAKMSVSVDGAETRYENAIGDLFFISVDLGERESVKVSITAQVEGKQPSKPIELTLSSDKNAKPKTVAVGSNSQLYSTDYLGISLLSEAQAEAVRAGLEQKISKVKLLSGRDTEYIYVIVPDKLTIYPEDAPQSLRDMLTTIEAYRSMVKNVRESAGMTVIDLTEKMKTHMVLESLYCQTGAIWTGFGSYVGYHSLMSRIAQKFSSVNVHELVDFSAATEENVGSELVTRLGLDGAVISESYLTLVRSFPTKARYAQSGDNDVFDITQAFISYTDNDSLPVAIVTRDAYGTEMLENIAEHFSKMMVLGEGEYTISDEMISEIKPDYIITIRCNGELS